MEKSFSALTRSELAKTRLGKERHLLAELAAFAFCSGTLKLGRGKVSLVLSSEAEDVILRAAAMIRKLYGREPFIRAVEKRQPKKHTVYSFEISPDQPEGALLFTIGLLTGSPDAIGFGDMDKRVFDQPGCFEAVLRGAFLGCGVLCDPHKGYRLEFVLSNGTFAAYLLDSMRENDIAAKATERGEKQVLYIKQVEDINKVLILSGATGAMLETENVRTLKDVKNQLNRADNCMIGNMGKTISAAGRQTEDIQTILTAGYPLTEPLKQACELRLAHPDATLAELAEFGGTTKSALNKRFIKLREIRESLG